MPLPKLSRLFKRANNHGGWLAMCVNAHGIYTAQVRHIGGRPHVVECAFHALRDPDPPALEKIYKAMHGGQQVTTLLAPGEYQLLLVDAPNVPTEELKKAIRWRIKDMLSYHIDDATVDVLHIPPRKEQGERPQSIYAVAAPNATLQKRIALFDQARVPLSVIDIPEMAQRNIAALYEEGDAALALLAINDDGGLLTFSARGELYLSRRIDITAGQLQDASEERRQQHRERVDLEVQRSLDYFGRQYHYLQVRRLLVSAPEGTGLEPELAANLALTVERLDLSQVMDISAAPALGHGDFATDALHALGAALRQERRAL